MQREKASWPVPGPRVSRKEFAAELASRLDISPEKALVNLEETLSLLVDYVNSGARIEFRGAFVMGSKYRRAREAHNPTKLDEKHTVPESRCVFFKPGKDLATLPYTPTDLRKGPKAKPAAPSGPVSTGVDGIS